MSLKHINIHSFKGIGTVEIKNCGSINAFIGKNNSGKSSILHAIDMAGLALGVSNWNAFQPKLEIKDLFSRVGAFQIDLTFDDDRTLAITANEQYGPLIAPEPDEIQRFNSILIFPDSGASLGNRSFRPPKLVIERLKDRDYSAVNAL